MDAADWQPGHEIAHPSLGSQGAQHVTAVVTGCVSALLGHVLLAA